MEVTCRRTAAVTDSVGTILIHDASTNRDQNGLFFVVVDLHRRNTQGVQRNKECKKEE